MSNRVDFETRQNRLTWLNSHQLVLVQISSSEITMFNSQILTQIV